MSDDLRVVVPGDPAVVLDMSRIEGDFINEDEPAFVLDHHSHEGPEDLPCSHHIWVECLDGSCARTLPAAVEICFKDAPDSLDIKLQSSLRLGAHLVSNDFAVDYFSSL